MKKYKLLLTIGSVSLLSVLPVISSSCVNKNDINKDKNDTSQSASNTTNSSNNNTSNNENLDESKNQDLPFAGYIKKNERVSKIHIKKLPEASSISDEVKSLKMFLVVDEGDLEDKSFNQSTWEALNLIYDQTQLVPQSIKPNQNDYISSYQSAIDNGARILVLPGFKHQKTIKEFIDQKRDELLNKKVHIVGVDFGVENINYPYFYSLQYKAKESAFVVGYATASFLADKYPNDPSKRLVDSFAGSAFSSVTDFNEGFLKGLYAFAKVNPDKKVQHTSKLQLNSSFENSDVMLNVVKESIATNASVILPVAGYATKVMLEELVKLNKDTYIVGVDVDQSLAHKENVGMFLSSITKEIGKSVYDIVTEILFPESIGTNYLDNEHNNGFVHYGSLRDNWVGYVPSTLSSQEEKEKMNHFLDEAERKVFSFSGDEIYTINSNKALPDDIEEIDDISVRLNRIIEAINEL